MRRFTVLYILMIGVCLASTTPKMRDAMVHVDVLNDRDRKVSSGLGMFISGFGEFAVLRSIVEKAQKDPLGHTIEFKTADGHPLNDIQFSHCDEDVATGFCYYKANYVPYRKIDLKRSNDKVKEGKLFYHGEDKKLGVTKIEAHPKADRLWASAEKAEGKIPGTVLFDQDGNPVAVVTENSL